MDDGSLTIGELAGRTNVAPSALRYYEEIGLLRPEGRVSGRRYYRASAVGLVGAILFLRDVGFTLGEVRRLMTARAKSPDAWRELARRKLDELDDQIARAQRARTAVAHAIACPHDDVVECPEFRAVVADRLAGRSLDERSPPDMPRDCYPSPTAKNDPARVPT